MKTKNPYVEFLTQQLTPLGEITSRAMFGGHCLYCDGVVFALVAGGALYLKADEVNRPRFEERRLAAFRPFEDKNAIMQYYEAPPEIFEDDDALKEWGGASVEAGRRAQEKKTKRKRR